MKGCVKGCGITIIVLAIATVFVLVIGARIRTVELRRASPSGKKIAVVESTLWTRLHGRTDLYLEERGKPPSRELIGSLLDNGLGVDILVGLIWSPDESRLAVVNNYDGAPPGVVIVDLRDRSGRALVPRPYTRGNSASLIRSMAVIVRTRCTIRTPAPDDLKWLAEPLSKMQSEGGDFLTVTCRDLDLDRELYLKSHKRGHRAP